MGFPEDLGKLALVKVKNESVAAAVEAVVSLQVEQVSQQAKDNDKVAPKEEKKVAVVQWVCEMCTVINQPGGTKCHICFGQAPASAYVDEEAEKAKQDAEDKAEKAKEEKLAREKELAEARIKQAELQK